MNDYRKPRYFLGKLAAWLQQFSETGTLTSRGSSLENHPLGLALFRKNKNHHPVCCFLRYNFQWFRSPNGHNNQRLTYFQVTFYGAEGHLLWGIPGAEVTFYGGKGHLLWGKSVQKSPFMGKSPGEGNIPICPKVTVYGGILLQSQGKSSPSGR